MSPRNLDTDRDFQGPSYVARMLNARLAGR